MADRDFRIDLLMRAHFEQAQAELEKANHHIGDISKSLDRANGFGAKFGIGMKAAGIAAAAAVSGALTVLGLYLAKTIEYEKVQAQLQSRLKDTGSVAGRTLQDLNEQAEKLQRTTIFSNDTIGNAQAVLLTFKQIRGVNFDRTIEQATNLATAWTIDVPDAAKILGKALSEPEKGLGALRKAGVTFTDAQTDQIKKMVEAGKIAEAQKVILDQLAGTMGTAASAARNTLGGAIDALHNSFDDLLKGKSGDAGVVGAREEIEDLIKVLNDPSTKQGFNNMIGGIVTVISKLVSFTSTVAQTAGFIGEQIAARVNGPAADDVVRIDERIARLKDTIAAVNQGGLRVVDAGLMSGELSASDLLKTPAAVIARLQGELDKEQNRLTIAFKLNAASARTAAKKIADDAAKPNPSPDGEDVVVHPPKPTNLTKAAVDADADIKKRIASLTEETALLGQVKYGEDKASEAAKARYDTTEGEFKNKSPQLKAELVAAAEALDAKNADIAAEKKRKEAIEETKKSYDEMVQGLRTPAEVAVDDAIAKLDVLNKALQAGIANKAEFDKEAGRIAAGAFDKAPDTSALQQDGRFSDPLSQYAELQKAQQEVEQWHQTALDELAVFRQKHAELNAQWDQKEVEIAQQYAQKQTQIQVAQQQVALSAVSSMFGSLAQIALAAGGEQSKAYRILFAISKGFAVAQAAASLAINVSKASEAGYPLNLVYIAGALAQGAQIASILSGANYGGGGGYAEGGYTGPGGKYQPAGIVHAGEGVLSQAEIAAIGGPSGFFALREAIEDGAMRQRIYGWAGYADGGLVGARGPVPSPDWTALDRNRSSALAGATVNNAMRVYLLQNEEQLAERLLSHPIAEQKVVGIVGDNGRAITAKW